MNIFYRLLQWLNPEIDLEALEIEPLDSLEGLDFCNKPDLLKSWEQFQADIAIYDPERYPEGSKIADDYIRFNDTTGVAADEQTKDFGVNYPEQVQFPQEYLNKSFPEWEKPNPFEEREISKQKPRNPPKPRKKVTKKKTTKKKKK